MFSLRIVLYVSLLISITIFFFFTQKTAYEMRISDWSTDGCSSDLCSPEELEEMRNTAKAEGRPMRYDGRWRDRDPKDAPAGVKLGRASCRDRVCQYG